MVRAPLHFHGRIPVPEVTPLTYRDGVTHLELVYELSQYLKNVLHPSLQSTIDQVVADAERLLSDATAQYVDGIQEFQRIHDAFMSDVNAHLVALNDGAVSDLVKDETSRLGEVLRELFPSHEVLDTTVTAVRNEMSLLETKTTEQLSDLGSHVNGRLAQDVLDDSYETRFRVNTRLMEGDTAQDRLILAITQGSPVHLDEVVHHDGNIAGLWSENISGVGVIQLPDGDVFTIEPNSTTDETLVNTVWISANGSADNDGLTKETAFDSLETVNTKVLQNLSTQQRNGARWIVRITGTITGSSKFENLGDFPNGLVFQGDEPVNGVPSSTIMKGNTAASRPIWFEPGISTVEFYDLHFLGWTGPYGYGVYFRFEGVLKVERCHFTNCQYGVAAIQGVTFLVDHNVLKRVNRTGLISQYGSTGHFNYNRVSADNAGGVTGVHVSRNTIVHCDYNTIEGFSGAGLRVDMASRAAVVENVFNANDVGVVVDGAAEWNNNNNTFYRSNRVAYEHHGGGREVKMHSRGEWTGNEYRIASTNLQYGNTQLHELSSGWTNIYRGWSAGEIPSQWFQSPGKYIRILFHGYATSAGVQLQFGSDVSGSDLRPFGSVTVPDSGFFTVEAYVYALTVSSQRMFATVSSANSSRTVSSGSTMDTFETRRIRLRASGSGSLTSYYMQVYTVG